MIKPTGTDADNQASVRVVRLHSSFNSGPVTLALNHRLNANSSARAIQNKAFHFSAAILIFLPKIVLAFFFPYHRTAKANKIDDNSTAAGNELLFQATKNPSPVNGLMKGFRI